MGALEFSNIYTVEVDRSCLNMQLRLLEPPISPDIKHIELTSLPLLTGNIVTTVIAQNPQGLINVFKHIYGPEIKQISTHTGTGVQVSTIVRCTVEKLFRHTVSHAKSVAEVVNNMADDQRLLDQIMKGW